MKRNELLVITILTSTFLFIGISTSELPTKTEHGNPIQEANISNEILTNFDIFSKLKLKLTEYLYGIVNKAVEKLLTTYIQKKKEELAKEESVTYNIKEQFSLNTSDMGIEGNISRVTVKNPSNFEMKEIKSYVQRNSIDFKLHFPKIITNNTSYTVKGKLFNQRIKTSGEIKLEMTDLNINCTIVYEFKNFSLFINSLKIHYNLSKAQVEFTNLKLPFLSISKLNEVLSVYLTQYLKKEEPKISTKLAKKIKDSVNKELQSLSLFTILEKIYENFIKRKSSRKCDPIEQLIFILKDIFVD